MSRVIARTALGAGALWNAARQGQLELSAHRARAGCHPLSWPSSLLVSVGFQGGQNLAVEGNIRPELPTFALSPMLHIWNMVRIFENSFLPKAKFSESTP